MTLKDHIKIYQRQEWSFFIRLELKKDLNLLHIKNLLAPFLNLKIKLLLKFNLKIRYIKNKI